MVEESIKLKKDASGVALGVLIPKLGGTQELTVGAAAATTTALDGATDITNLIAIGSTVAINLAIGVDPSGSVDSAYFLPAGGVQFFRFANNDKVSVISEDGAAPGRAYISILL